MQIHQVSAALDNKIAQLDKKLAQVEAQHKAQPSSQTEKDVEALHQMRAKLLKSKTLAWRAHQLQDDTDEAKRAQQRMMGLSLCALSLVGAVILVVIVLL